MPVTKDSPVPRLAVAATTAAATDRAPGRAQRPRGLGQGGPRGDDVVDEHHLAAGHGRPQAGRDPDGPGEVLGPGQHPEARLVADAAGIRSTGTTPDVGPVTPQRRRRRPGEPQRRVVAARTHRGRSGGCRHQQRGAAPVSSTRRLPPTPGPRRAAGPAPGRRAPCARAPAPRTGPSYAVTDQVAGSEAGHGSGRHGRAGPPSSRAQAAHQVTPSTSQPAQLAGSTRSSTARRVRSSTRRACRRTDPQGRPAQERWTTHQWGQPDGDGQPG